MNREQVEALFKRNEAKIEFYGFDFLFSEPETKNELLYVFNSDVVTCIDMLFDEDDEIYRMAVTEDEYEKDGELKILVDIEHDNISEEEIQQLLDVTLERLKPTEVFDLDNMEKCPICSADMKVTKEENDIALYKVKNIDCPNRCCRNHLYTSKSISHGGKIDYMIEIFDHHISFYSGWSHEEVVGRENKIKHMIAYWKKNDRYIVKLMGVDMDDVGGL